MGSIQWKRGSARQVPPQTYQWAYQPPETDETADNWRATALIMAVGTLVFLGFGAVAWIIETLSGEKS